MLAVLLCAAASERTYSSEHVKHVFEAALIGIRPSGEQFEAAVERIGAKLFGRDVLDVSLTHPVGWPAATVVGFFGHDEVFLIYRSHGHTRADVLPYGPVSADPGLSRRPYLFAWSQGKLAEFYTSGGSGESVYGEAYKHAGDRWRRVQTLDQHGELSMQGYNLSDRVKSRHPLVVELNFTDHEWLEKYFHGSHFAPGLKFRERWRFAEGRLRRTVLYRVPTPMAALYDLKVAARHGRRSEFDEHVPRALRKQLWAILSQTEENGIGHDPTKDEHEDVDDGQDLLLDRRWRLQFQIRRHKWVVASMTPWKEVW